MGVSWRFADSSFRFRVVCNNMVGGSGIRAND